MKTIDQNDVASLATERAIAATDPLRLRGADARVGGPQPHGKRHAIADGKQLERDWRSRRGPGGDKERRGGAGLGGAPRRQAACSSHWPSNPLHSGSFLDGECLQ